MKTLFKNEATLISGGCDCLNDNGDTVAFILLAETAMQCATLCCSVGGDFGYEFGPTKETCQEYLEWLALMDPETDHFHRIEEGYDSP